MNSPAFQFYPADFLVGTADMSAEEVGGYMRLLCYQWTKGGLPNDDSKLSIMAGCGGNAMASIRHKFGIGDDGKLRNERMERVRAEQDSYRARQAENASKRWKKDGLAMPPQCDGNATAHAVGMPEWVPNTCPSPSPSKVKVKKTASPTETDDEWMDGLQRNIAYSHVNVRAEAGKAQVWISMKKGRRFTRLFFMKWLNKAADDQRPLDLHSSGMHTAVSAPVAEISEAKRREILEEEENQAALNREWLFGGND